MLDLLGAVSKHMEGSAQVARRALAATQSKSGPVQYVQVSSTSSGGRPISRDWSFEGAVKHGYKANSWAFASIDRICKALSSVPWCVKEREGGTWERQEGHELERRLENPNPKMSRKWLMWFQGLHLLTSGNALQRLVVDEQWPLHPGRTTPVADEQEWVKHYEQRDARGRKGPPIPPAEVVHAQIPDPTNPLWGMSPLQAGGAVVDTDTAAVHWNRDSMENRAVPDGALVDPNALSEEQYEQLEDELELRAMGSRNARRPLILAGGSTWVPMQNTPVEMDFVSGRKQFASEIAAVLGHLAAMFSAEAQTYDNLTTAVRYMWQNAVLPLLDLFADAYTLVLVPQEQRGEVKVAYDTTSVDALQDALEKRIEMMERAVRSGVPPLVAARIVDLPVMPEDIPGGDVPLVDGRLVSLQELLAGGAAGGLL